MGAGRDMIYVRTTMRLPIYYSRHDATATAACHHVPPCFPLGYELSLAHVNGPEALRVHMHGLVCSPAREGPGRAVKTTCPAAQEWRVGRSSDVSSGCPLVTRT